MTFEVVEGNDHPVDQVDSTKIDRVDRLELEGVRPFVGGPDIEVRVVLHRQADHVADRVLGLLGEILIGEGKGNP